MLNIRALLAKMLGRLNTIGTVYTAAWTANSSAANNLKLTDTITLPYGTYVVTLKTPGVTSGYGGIHLEYDNNGTATALDSFSICLGGSFSAESIVINLNPTPLTEYEIWIATSFSASCTYSYKERGGLRAIKIK